MRTLIQVVCLAAIALVALLTGNKYEWMAEMDPSVPANAVEDASGNSAVFAGLVLIVVLVVQAVLFVSAKGLWEKMTSVLVVVLALSMWWIRVA